MSAEKHVNDSIKLVSEIFNKFSFRIEAMSPGSKISTTTLANEIAKDYGMTGPQIYPFLKLLTTGYPNIIVKRGAKGGLLKLAENESSSISNSSLEVELEIDENESLPIINT